MPKREVLLIPMGEIKKQLAVNKRDDAKIVAPKIMTDELYDFLTVVKGRDDVKQEEHLKGNRWTHSSPNRRNKICEAEDFDGDCSPENTKGLFAVSFVNEHAKQVWHIHDQHTEIYFSEHPMVAEYKLHRNPNTKTGTLKDGGGIIFGPGVAHKMKLRGLTIVIEIPALEGDKRDDI